MKLRSATKLSRKLLYYPSRKLPATDYLQSLVVIVWETSVVPEDAASALHDFPSSTIQNVLPSDSASCDAKSYEAELDSLRVGDLRTRTLVAEEIFRVSDARLKSHMEPLEPQLEKLELLKAYRYEMNSQVKVGLSAQQVQGTFPESVQQGPYGWLAVDYGGFVPRFVVSLKEVATKLRALEATTKVQRALLSTMLLFFFAAVFVTWYQGDTTYCLVSDYNLPFTDVQITRPWMHDDLLPLVIGGNLVITGPAGSGKSILASQMFETDLVRTAYPRCRVWLDMGNSSSMQYELRRLARVYNRNETIDISELSSLIGHRDCLMVLDNVSDARRAAAIVQRCDSNVRFVMTARMLPDRLSAHGFQEYVMLPLVNADVDALVAAFVLKMDGKQNAHYARDIADRLYPYATIRLMAFALDVLAAVPTSTKAEYIQTETIGRKLEESGEERSVHVAGPMLALSIDVAASFCRQAKLPVFWLGAPSPEILRRFTEVLHLLSAESFAVVVNYNGSFSLAELTTRRCRVITVSTDASTGSDVRIEPNLADVPALAAIVHGLPHATLEVYASLGYLAPNESFSDIVNIDPSARRQLLGLSLIYVNEGDAVQLPASMFPVIQSLPEFFEGKCSHIGFLLSSIDSTWDRMSTEARDRVYLHLQHLTSSYPNLARECPVIANFVPLFAAVVTTSSMVYDKKSIAAFISGFLLSEDDLVALINNMLHGDVRIELKNTFQVRISTARAEILKNSAELTFPFIGWAASAGSPWSNATVVVALNNLAQHLLVIGACRHVPVEMLARAHALLPTAQFARSEDVGRIEQNYARVLYRSANGRHVTLQRSCALARSACGRVASSKATDGIEIGTQCRELLSLLKNDGVNC
eukprot:TRINITY_DN11955_c0_g1_i2.p1 TRINITY_DN11955_c0_g1~~TRINITY_DN11955_c0_g1_i2.p1  ORF type:complete len:871 (+),score=95.89 TRINITY_DN11955_c0_g1_i2:363-2975(+)